MLKNPKDKSNGWLRDQIIPINGMLKNRFLDFSSLKLDQIIPINGMLKNRIGGY